MKKKSLPHEYHIDLASQRFQSFIDKVENQYIFILYH